jgi:hypothetical protein
MGIEEIRKIKAGTDKKPEKRKGIAPISEKRRAKLAAEKEARGDSETQLQQWYSHIMATEEPVCWETGERINKEDELGWRGSIAHILPKNLFPSVATHPLNYMILKMWGGTHTDYDSSWSKAKLMKVWPIAVERFLQFEKDIADNERKYLPNCFLLALQAKEEGNT